MKNIRITVPASSGNLGPGFDSIGMALKLYLRLEVTDSDDWTYSSSNTEAGREHFVFQIAEQTARRHGRELPPCHVKENNEIPLARGLGSSSSAILAGIELANQLCGLELSLQDKLRYGTEIEGHPDNIAPSLFGGIVVSHVEVGDIDWIQIPDTNLDAVVFIPDVELKTEAARKVLPDSYTRQQAVAASSVSSMLLAALQQGNYQLAGKMMERDLFHEPYRASIIPNYEQIRREASVNGALGTVISGAGPTMLSLALAGKGQALADRMKAVLPKYRVRLLEIDRQGIQVESIS